MTIRDPAEARVLEERLRSAIDAHYRSLRRATRRLGVPEFEVDDVLQDAFLAFHRKAALVQPGSERQFLFQAVFRVVLSRQRNFVRRREEFEPAFEQFSEVRLDPEEEMSRQQSLEMIDGVLAAMPLELRMVFNLCEIEQVAVPEAAAILDVPVGTATSRLRRARELFKKLGTRSLTAARRGNRR